MFYVSRLRTRLNVSKLFLSERLGAKRKLCFKFYYNPLSIFRVTVINEWVVQCSVFIHYTHTLSGGPTKFTILDLNVPIKKEFGVYPSRKNSLVRLSWHFARKRCFYNLVYSSHMDLQYFRFDVIAYSPTQFQDGSR